MSKPTYTIPSYIGIPPNPPIPSQVRMYNITENYICPACLRSNKHLIEGNSLFLNDFVKISTTNKKCDTKINLYYCKSCFEKEAPQEVLSRLE